MDKLLSSKTKDSKALVEQLLEQELLLVVSDLQAGRGFSLNQHPGLPLLLIGYAPAAGGPEHPAVDGDSWERLVEECGEQMASLLTTTAATLGGSSVELLAREYVCVLREYLARREAIIAAASKAA